MTRSEFVESVHGSDNIENLKARLIELSHRTDTWAPEPVEAPEPGEGWREIDPEVDEPQEGDELWFLLSGVWKERACPLAPFSLYDHYRRRVTDPLAEEAFRLLERAVELLKKATEHMDTREHSQHLYYACEEFIAEYDREERKE